MSKNNRPVGKIKMICTKFSTTCDPWISDPLWICEQNVARVTYKKESS